MSLVQAFMIVCCWTVTKTHECKYKHDAEYGGVKVVCSNLAIKKVPENLPDNTTYLDLTFNNFTVLHNGDFSNLSRLHYLDVSFNPIHTLQNACFIGLTSLSVLELIGHKLNYSEVSMPFDVFTPLESLIRLTMRSDLSQFPEHKLTLPVQALSRLSKLTNLSIDTGYETKFQQGFFNLTQLRYLVLGVVNGMKCGLDKVTNETFQGLSNTPVLYLDLNQCIFGSFHVDSFIHLSHLKFLYMQDVETSGGDISVIIEALHVFKKKNMSVLSITGLRSNDLFYSSGGSLLLKIISDICVSEIDFRDSNIFNVDFEGVFLNNSKIIKCIRRFNIAINRITVSHVTKIWFLFFPWLTQLEYFDASLQLRLNPEKILSTRYRHKTQPSKFLFGIPIFLPSNLKSLNIAGMSYTIGVMADFYVFNGKHLTYLNMSYCGLYNFNNKTLIGIENLETLDLSFNDASQISSTFFDTFPNLKTLGISNCFLDNEFMLQNGTRLLNPLKLLEFIDLSGNELVVIPYDLFKSLHKLRSVNLANNNLISLPDVSHIYHLKLFDIGHNALTSINATFRRMLETSQKNNENLTTILQGNTFSCTCADSDFLLWLVETSVKVDKNDYSCIDSEGHFTDTKSITNRWASFQQKCHSSFWLNVSIGATSFTIVTLIISFVFIKNEMKIKLFFLRLTNQRVRPRKRCDFLFDAFIIYTNTMCEWVCTDLAEELEKGHGLKLNLTDRDHIPGGSKAEDISEAIRDSWKIVLILSPEFLTSDLAYYIMCSCLSCITLTTPQRLIVVIDEDTRLPANLDFLLEPVTQNNILNVKLQPPFVEFPIARLAEIILQQFGNE